MKKYLILKAFLLATASFKALKYPLNLRESLKSFRMNSPFLDFKIKMIYKMTLNDLLKWSLDQNSFCYIWLSFFPVFSGRESQRIWFSNLNRRQIWLLNFRRFFLFVDHFSWFIVLGHHLLQAGGSERKFIEFCCCCKFISFDYNQTLISKSFINLLLN